MRGGVYPITGATHEPDGGIRATLSCGHSWVLLSARKDIPFIFDGHTLHVPKKNGEWKSLTHTGCHECNNRQRSSTQ